MKKNLILLIVVSVAGMGFATTTYDLSKGDVTVPANTTAIIKQANTITSVVSKVTINDGAVVTLSGINISAQGDVSAIECLGTATLILADGSSNTVAVASGYKAAIYAGGTDSTLTIKGSVNGSGILVANAEASNSGKSAAIGSDRRGGRNCGNIVIEGGMIYAYARSGAAIGGSNNSSCGDITITGGSVFATSGNAGIGGCCENILISGGDVTAKSVGAGAGIGAYNSAWGRSHCGTINIEGGHVMATGGGGSSGIGAAGNGGVGDINIIGGVVTAIGGEGATGIGAGRDSSCGAITIEDNVEKVTATKGDSTVLAYIGKANSSSSVGTVTIGSKLQKTLSNNNLTQTLTPAYTITWKDSNGTTLETDTLVLRGTTPTYNGATPTKASTAQYSYTFAGWSPAVAAATADKTYTATYTQTVRSYKVTWKDDDGTTLKTDTLLYGAMPDYGANPTKESTAQYSYAFAGWSPSIVAVTGAATYTATYNATERIPTIDDYASEEAVNAAVDSANFADAAVKAVIGGNASEYRAFKTWASGVAGGEAAVVASTNAAVSYMLGAERLFVNAPEIEFGECEVATDTGEVVISITVKDDEDAVAVASEKVKEMFEATSDLNDWYSTGKRLVPVVTDLSQGQSSILRFRVLPGDGTSPSAFLRIRK